MDPVPRAHASSAASRRAAFLADGFLVLDELVAPEACEALRVRLEKVLSGVYDTGVAPDKFPKTASGKLANVSKRTLQVVNVWKSDSAFRAVVHSRELGRLVAALGGWSGARVANDQVFAKPPGAGPLSFHRDSSYFEHVFTQAKGAEEGCGEEGVGGGDGIGEASACASAGAAADGATVEITADATANVSTDATANATADATAVDTPAIGTRATDALPADTPSTTTTPSTTKSTSTSVPATEVITVWIALDDMEPELGPLQYVAGSHRWGDARFGSANQFFNKGWTSLLHDAAEKEGVAPRDIEMASVGVRTGGAGIHNGRTWHGSGPNAALDRPRRGLGIHFIPAESTFVPGADLGPLWAPHRLCDGDVTLSDAAFPVTWSAAEAETKGATGGEGSGEGSGVGGVESKEDSVLHAAAAAAGEEKAHTARKGDKT